MYAKLIFAAWLTFASLHAVADAPPERIAPHATGVAAYAQAALDAYGEGYAFIERAARLEEDALNGADKHDETSAQANEFISGARLAYQDALTCFEKAVTADQRMYEAHTYIGYANRKLGNHMQALGAYDTALRLKPDYARAIEYQGEAYLALDRFEDAKRNYLRLYALDSNQADTLLSAMHEWFDSRHSSNAAVATNAAQWLKTRPRPQVSAHRLAHW